MFKKLICLALAACLTTGVAGTDTPTPVPDNKPTDSVEIEDHVLILTDANFDETIAKYDHILVEFYAPWCGHCKKLTPEFSKAAKTLGENSPPYMLAKVDATVQKKVAAKYKVKGFPTLFFFKSGKEISYNGGRTADTIVSWVLKKTGPPSSLVTCDELKKKVEDNKLVMAFFGDATSAEFKIYEQTAMSPSGEKLQFVHTVDQSCAQGNGVTTQLPAVVLFRKFDENTVVFSGKIENPALTDFMSAQIVPTLITFSDEYISPLMNQKKASIYLIRADDQKDSAYMKTFAQASKDLKGTTDVLFVETGVTNGIQKKLAEFIGVTAADLPTMRILNSVGMKKYTWEDGKVDDQLTVDNISKFIQDFKSGSLKSKLKSAEIPASPLEGEVTILVGKNFKDVVTDNENDDILVMFYAPWCGHCKKLAPIWDQLSKDLKDVKGLKIAKMDATANEVEGLAIKGYPAIKFYPKGSKGVPIDYSGKREFEDFKTWLGEKSGSYKEWNVVKSEL